MSASPLGTVPVTSMVLKPASRKPAVNQTTCFAGPPTFNRAIILITFGLRIPGCEELLCITITRNRSSLCNLCVLCVSVVSYCYELINHRDTENTEVAQRNH